MSQFCSHAVYGVCPSMSPSAVTLVSICAGVIGLIYRMQPKQSGDEDFGMAPMEVDSSSSDNLFGQRCPGRQNSRQLHCA
eukprot:4225831-Pyramimonas_sp.AAC.1